jgi:hypothetical protein
MISLEIIKELPSSVWYTFEAIAIAGLTIWAIKLYIKRKRAAKRALYPKDVVILHQFPRGARAPSPSPFPLKLETW